MLVLCIRVAMLRPLPTEACMNLTISTHVLVCLTSTAPCSYFFICTVLNVIASVSHCTES